MADTPETTPAAMTILVVEDSPTQLEELRFLLKEAGFSVATATNGEEGLAAAKATPIDLVISDIVMPEMDGYTLCKALRADPALRHLPVILLTSLADPRDVIRGLESGANNFICKPYDGRGLLARVQNIFANQEIRKAASSQMGINIFFAGQPFFITADRLQILDLLLSTYEVAIQQNRDVLSAREELRSQNVVLEKTVRERTANLMAEIAERERAEGTLRLQSAALNATAIPIVITDCNGTIQWINPAFTVLTGYSAEEAIGRNPRDLVKSGVHDQAFYKHLWDTILAGNVWGGEMTNRRKDGSLYPEVQTITPVKDARGEITHFIAIKRDLTEQRQLEAQFLQAQKMETVGRLAGGIAHDFNNLLTVINGTAELASMDLREDDPLRTDFDEIRRAGDRAAALTRQLLAFSRKQIMKFEVLNLGTLVVNLGSMLQRLIGEHITLVTPAQEVGGVMADPVQIEQVVMNLVVNARDAMPNGGTLIIETRDVALDAAYAATHPSVQPGPHVMLAISDTGVGMDEATRTRIFEPFFTTKDPGKGTGLGLSTVYGIVKQSGGSIWVYSEPGKGTTFKIYLPRVDVVAPQGQTAPTVTSGRGTETLLIVEDEEAVQHLASRVLQLAGYSVLTASNGVEALAVLGRHDGPVHLVLTDMIMPGMSGRELVARIEAISPRMKVLYTSGYTDEAISRDILFDRATHFIGKPYAAAELTRRVREALDAPDHD